MVFDPHCSHSERTEDYPDLRGVPLRLPSLDSHVGSKRCCPVISWSI